jgi:hypothetical protein
MALKWGISQQLEGACRRILRSKRRPREAGEKSDWAVEILGASGELLHRVALSWLTHMAGIE